MYIPEFWCGFITGVIITIAGITAWVILYNRRHE